MHTKTLFDRVTIIGLGLIGSSIARGIKKQGLAATVVGCDLNETSLAFGRQQNIIDVAAYDPAVSVSNSQMVILCTPPSTLGNVSRLIGPALMHNAIVMDTCSVKHVAMQAMTAQLPTTIQLVPAHPIAGSEQTGVMAGRADLFVNRRVIVTPDKPLQGDVLQKVNAFWEALGARVEGMPASLHDHLYAYVSHLPQLLAFACAVPLAHHLSGKEEIPSEQLIKFLRLSASNQDLWADIFKLNKDNIINALDAYLNVISHIHDELTQAPEEDVSARDDNLARSRLFPLIAASCLVTTVMQAEKKAGFSFARFAGTGFVDFTAPATSPPDEAIGQISNQSLALRPVLREFIAELKQKREQLNRMN